MYVIMDNFIRKTVDYDCLNTSRTHKLFSYCQTSLAVGRCTIQTVLIGVNLFYKSDCRSATKDTDLQSNQQSLSDSSSEITDSFLLKPIMPTSQLVAASCMVTKTNAVEDKFGSTGKLFDHITLDEAGQTMYLWQSECSIDVKLFINNYFNCQSFFGGLMWCTTRILEEKFCSRPLASEPFCLYANFMRTCHKSLLIRLSIKRIKQAEMNYQRCRCLVCCSNCLHEGTRPLCYSPQNDIKLHMENLCTISDSNFANSPDLCLKDCYDYREINTIDETCNRTRYETIDSLDSKLLPEMSETVSTVCTELSNCCVFTDFDNMVDNNIASTEEPESHKLDVCDDIGLMNQDVCFTSWGTDESSHGYFSDKDRVLCNHPDMQQSDDEEWLTDVSCDEDDSDDDVVWGSTNDLHNQHSDVDLAETSQRSSLSRPVCSSFFICGSVSDDTDSTSSSDNEEHFFEAVNCDVDDDEDWLEHQDNSDLPSLSDLDPFQVSGLYIPPCSTTPLNRPITTSKDTNKKCVESQLLEDSSMIKHINKKWNQVYKNKPGLGVSPKKKVLFAESVPVVIPMINEDEWAEDYRNARSCYWEEFARDRDRFRRRILDTAAKIDWIFDTEHRAKVITNAAFF